MARRIQTRIHGRHRVVAMLAALAAAALAGLTACERSPSAPDYDNPFDPAGPEAGDPLALSATVSGGNITLVWSQPQNLDIAEYVISHSLSAGGPWETLDVKPQTEAAENLYFYIDPAPTSSHWFLVQALTADGGFSIVSYVTPGTATLGPRVAIGNGGTTTATRQAQLHVTVSRGTDLQIARGPDFVDTQTFAAADSGVVADIDFDLGPAAQGDTLRVRVTAVGPGFTSVPTTVSARVSFDPNFRLASGGTVVGTRTPTLTVPEAGVLNMRFATTEAGLAAAAWQPAATAVTAPELTVDAAPQSIWGEFEGDFGFTSTPRELVVTPDLLADAAFKLVLPANRVTEQSTVSAVVSGARAELMRWSEGPDLGAQPWRAFADTFDITFSPAAGLKTIYLQVRNPWADSPILTDYAIHLTLPVEVDFIAPTAGQTLAGGVPLLVRGRAAAGAGAAAVDSVEFDAADGLGFRAVDGKEDWTFIWNVPAVTVSTDLDLRARAWAAGEVATAVIPVTIVP